MHNLCSPANDISYMQALEVIHELQKHFPIKRSPMRLRICVPEKDFSSLLEKLNVWNANVVLKDYSGSQPSVVSPSPVMSTKKCSKSRFTHFLIQNQFVWC
jgi:hypothetical protein